MKPQNIQVLKRLKRGPLTPLQSWRELGVYRLAAAILDLRKAKVKILTTMKYVRGARFAEYSLTQGSRH